ncbi:hypothetical protein EDEG_02927 [Edhazardia aedis USNM 41457]|uniref:Uncharacterized protein n=1 Tax=Edhazardia aedis (strain USNM 41457) TaxID=1003232 RepID=J9DJ95_EDHAE|nr:hypothetical protein EDEG_02927 [Edhazardia aedis USNM 41457]|eukprot:EJW02675.1 hypothetical protein EDEG_02927 [Edhazardia aedis USNM 41457]
MQILFFCATILCSFGEYHRNLIDTSLESLLYTLTGVYLIDNAMIEKDNPNQILENLVINFDSELKKWLQEAEKLTVVDAGCSNNRENFNFTELYNDLSDWIKKKPESQAISGSSSASNNLNLVNSIFNPENNHIEEAKTEQSPTDKGENNISEKSANQNISSTFPDSANTFNEKMNLYWKNLYQSIHIVLKVSFSGFKTNVLKTYIFTTENKCYTMGCKMGFLFDILMGYNYNLFYKNKSNMNRENKKNESNILEAEEKNQELHYIQKTIEFYIKLECTLQTISYLIEALKVNLDKNVVAEAIKKLTEFASMHIKSELESIHALDKSISESDAVNDIKSSEKMPFFRSSKEFFSRVCACYFTYKSFDDLFSDSFIDSKNPDINTSLIFKMLLERTSDEENIAKDFIKKMIG